MDKSYKLVLNVNKMLSEGLENSTYKRFKKPLEALDEACKLNMEFAFVFKGYKLYGIYHYKDGKYIKLGDWKTFE